MIKFISPYDKNGYRGILPASAKAVDEQAVEMSSSNLPVPAVTSGCNPSDKSIGTVMNEPPSPSIPANTPAIKNTPA